MDEKITQLLREFNNSVMEYPKDKTLQELFEQQVNNTPNKPAVIDEDNSLTYRELNEKSNNLAKSLIAKGVKPDQIVGIMVDDNNIEIVVGILAILKAGGAFLPIDSEFPEERIEFILKDSDISILLSKTDLKKEVHFKGEIVNIASPHLFDGESFNLEIVSQPHDLAYVIYTSGSTGKPKGVQIEHTSIVNQIFGLKKRYTFDSSLHHILLAPFTFDPSVQQIFLPLTTGGKLFLVSKSTKHNTKKLSEFIVNNDIQLVNTVPSFMNVLVENFKGHNLHLKYLILAGEVFTKNLYMKIKESISAEIIINIYGPTEATINTTLYECKDNDGYSTVPIGKPLMNYKVYILDERRNLLPIGSPGEIYISGVGLARGYLNNHHLTSEKFVENPFEPDKKMYRTGDLGLWTVDGNIEFLGRIDNQVKIRGFRVELGEIEVTLRQHLHIQETVVVDQKDNFGNTRLVAYLVPNPRRSPEVSELRSFLADKLPGYMVPSLFVKLETLPLTPNGKVDRRALPEPDLVQRKSEMSYVSPRNKLEYKMAKIWRKVLGIQTIGVKDNFFELGGQSLQAMVMSIHIEKIFKKSLPLATLIAAPTIEQLIRTLCNDKWRPQWSPLVTIQSRGSKSPFFCIHGYRGNVLSFCEWSKQMGPDQPFYALQARGLDLDWTDLRNRSIADMATDYLKEIKTVQSEGPYFLGGYSMGGLIAYHVARLLKEKGEEIAILALIQTYHPKFKNYPYNLRKYKRFLYRTTDKLEYEIGNLKVRGNKKKLLYFRRKINTALIQLQVFCEKLLKSILGMFRIRITNSKSLKLYSLYDSHIVACKNYIPSPYSGKVVIFKACQQPHGIATDPTLGWSPFLEKKPEVVEIPGNHMGVELNPLSMKTLAKKLKSCLLETQEENAV